MPSIIPPKRPQLNAEEMLAWAYENDLDRSFDGVILLSIRGYYLDSMGVPGQNDRNMYDDAVAVLEIKDMRVVKMYTFNFNVDPSERRNGMAFILPDVYKYQKGKHRGQYWALRQASPVRLDRDGAGGLVSGYFGINIHKGGLTNTWSLGCQTVPQTQWDEFKELVYSLMTKYNQAWIYYVVTEELERREWKADYERERQAAAGGQPPARPFPVAAG